MISQVTWQYLILGDSSGSGYRVKRRIGGMPPPILDGRTETINGDSWDRVAPNALVYQGRTYVLAFWSVVGQDTLSPQREAHLEFGPIASSSHPGAANMGGGAWTVLAKAFYVWDFGSGPGDHAVLIDAFDIELGDFIPDDFVSVSPDDPAGTLSLDANNGYVDTTTQIQTGAPITITAFDAVRPNKTFAYWRAVPSLTHSGSPNEGPPTIGVPHPREIVAHQNDIVVAFAFYHSTPLQPRPPRHYEIYDPWWWIPTHGGLTPPDPIDPWLGEFAAALALAGVAQRVAPQLRAAVLEIALQQIGVTAASIQREIRNLGSHGNARS